MFLKEKWIYLFYVYYLNVCMDTKCIRSPEYDAMNGCEPPCGCWKGPNQGPLQK